MNIEQGENTPVTGEEQIIPQTLEERIQDLEARKKELKLWMSTGAKSREDGEELERINNLLKELKG